MLQNRQPQPQQAAQLPMPLRIPSGHKIMISSYIGFGILRRQQRHHGQYSASSAPWSSTHLWRQALPAQRRPPHQHRLHRRPRQRRQWQRELGQGVNESEQMCLCIWFGCVSQGAVGTLLLLHVLEEEFGRKHGQGRLRDKHGCKKRSEGKM